MSQRYKRARVTGTSMLSCRGREFKSRDDSAVVAFEKETFSLLHEFFNQFILEQNSNQSSKPYKPTSLL